MTKIEWTHIPGLRGETWNPIRAENKATGSIGHYCAHVHDGCTNCYAEAMQKRLFNNPIRYAAQDLDKVDLFLDGEVLRKPFKWRKPRCIFISMTDPFGEFVSPSWVREILTVAALTPHHTYILLTKRPARMRAVMLDLDANPRLPEYPILAGARMTKGAVCRDAVPLSAWPLSNVWLGVSVSRQADAEEFVLDLVETPAAKRIVSVEPMLEHIDLSQWFDRIDWVLCGGESGPKARPMHLVWARYLRDQCAEAGVPFFFKQWGEWAPGRDVLPDGCDAVMRLGKKRAGRMLDGKEHNEFPHHGQSKATK
jgi:protein gp37